VGIRPRTSPPRAGARIETRSSATTSSTTCRRPHARGRGLKPRRDRRGAAAPGRRPHARRRGLKRGRRGRRAAVPASPPRAGARIETWQSPGLLPMRSRPTRGGAIDQAPGDKPAAASTPLSLTQGHTRDITPMTRWVTPPRPPSDRNGGRFEIGMGGRFQIGIPGRLHRNLHAKLTRALAPSDHVTVTV
jgi:hypothetical protein